MKLLVEEGFARNGMVDIFDAGPIVQCKRDQIRSVRESKTAKVADIVDALSTEQPMIVSASKKEFRACKGEIELLPAGVRLSSRTAMALNAKVGDSVRYVTMRPASAAA
jgi:arginine N-succinyltransferase